MILLQNDLIGLGQRFIGSLGAFFLQVPQWMLREKIEVAPVASSPNKDMRLGNMTSTRITIWL